jgi:RNA polymerase sigma-70 factor (ECF subfamily)
VDGASASTRVSLLGRLHQDPRDQSAWKEFVDRYGPRIHAWCCRWGLQEADAQDVTQMVLVRLAAKLRSFAYDPSGSFRGWLRTLTRHAWSDFISDRHRAASRPGEHDVTGLLDTLQAREDLESHLEEAFDLELLEIATERVRQRVQPQTWRAFELTALQGLPGAEAAALVPMHIATLFKAKSKVQQMLREEIARLEGQGPA